FIVGPQPVGTSRVFPQPAKADKSWKYDREQYISRVKDEVGAYLAPTFLNIEATAERAAERAFTSFKERLLLWATVAAVVVALLAIFAPLGASLVDKCIGGRDQRELQLEQTLEKKLEDRHEARLKEISQQIEQLQRNKAERPGHGNASAGKP